MILMIIVILMLITACGLGAVSLVIAIKEDFKDREWGPVCGMGACFLLLLVIMGLLVCVLICCLASGGIEGC